MNEKRNKLTALTVSAILAAAALAASFFERTLTAGLPLPPGVKPGLSNVAVTFACAALGLPYALAVTAIKAGFTLLTAGFSALISKGSLASDSGRLLSRLAFGAAVFTACWLTVRGCAGKRLLWSLLCGGILCACALLSALLPGTAEFHPAAVCGISALAAGIGAVLGSRQKRKIL